MPRRGQHQQGQNGQHQQVQHGHHPNLDVCRALGLKLQVLHYEYQDSRSNFWT